MIHHVFANRSNVGDRLSAIGIQELLGPQPLREHLCDEPFIDDTVRALGRAGPDDLVVLGGGGLFMDYFTSFWEAFLTVAEGLRYAIWGVGAVDLKRESSLPSGELLEAVARGSELCVVRDPLTRDLLGILDLPPPVPCPSVVAVEPADQPGWGLLHVANFTTAGADVYDIMRREGMAFAERTGRPYRETNNRYEGGDSGLRRVLELYARSDVILTSALHGCVVALGMGRPVVAVSGDRKIEAFMDAAGLGDWVVTQESAEAVVERLVSAGSQPDTSGFLAEAQEGNRSVAARVRALLSGEERTA